MNRMAELSKTLQMLERLYYNPNEQILKEFYLHLTNNPGLFSQTVDEKLTEIIERYPHLDPKNVCLVLRDAILRPSRSQGIYQTFSNFVFSMGTNYLRWHEQTSKLDFLQKGILLYETTLRLGPSASTRVECINYLATSYELRFELLRCIDDLEKAMNLLEPIIHQISADQMFFEEMLNTQGLCLLHRSEKGFETSKSDDLDRAIGLFHRILKEGASDSPTIPIALNNYASALLKRSKKRKGNSQDLNLAIEALQDAFSKKVPNDVMMSYSNNYCSALMQRFELTNDMKDLNTAISIYEGMLPFVASTSSERILFSLNYVQTLCKRYKISGSATDIEKAIKQVEAARAASLSGPFPDKFVECILAIDDVQIELYQKTREVTCLDRIIEETQEALRIVKKGHGREKILYRLGFRLIERYLRCRQISDLNDAVKASMLALEEISPSCLERFDYVANLVEALNYRYIRLGSLADLLEAIDIAETALQTAPSIEKELSPCLMSQAESLLNAYYCTKNLDYMERAIVVLETVININPPNSTDLFFGQFGMGVALAARYASTHNESDLVKSNSFLRAAVSIAPRQQDLRKSLGTLAENLLMLYKSNGNKQNLDEAISGLRKAVEVQAQPRPDDGILMASLALCLRLRFEDTKDITVLKEASAMYEKAAVMASEFSLRNSFFISREWFSWALTRKNWDEVTKAYKYINKAETEFLKVQYLREHKEQWLSETQEMASIAAYAMGRLGDFKTAIVLLEQGLAKLLSEALQLNEVDLINLAKTEHANLVAGFKIARKNLDEINGRIIESEYFTSFSTIKRASLTLNQSTRKWVFLQQQNEISDKTTELQVAHKKLEQAINAIRSVSGYERFLSFSTFDDIKVCAKEKPVLYLLATTAGSLAIFFTPAKEDSDEIHHLWIDEFRIEDFYRILNTGYAKGVVLGETEELIRALDRFWPDLEKLMKPIAECLKNLGFHNATLIPIGALSLLPLYAVSIGKILFSLAPSARALKSAQETGSEKRRMIIERTNAKKEKNPLMFFGVGDPLPSHNPLCFARKEVEDISALFPNKNQNLLYEEEATLSEISKAFSGATHLHFSCHGNFLLDKPLESHLSLSGPDKLTLKDLLLGDFDLSAVLLVVLSACETGATDVKSLPDESIGFPAGLIQVGVPTILSTLWSVNEISTSLLMTRFYQLLIENRSLLATQALSEAVEWLRNDVDRNYVITQIDALIRNMDQKRALNPFSDKSLNFIKRVIDRLKTSRRKLENDEKKDPGGKPYSHPYYWAAFMISGEDTNPFKV